MNKNFLIKKDGKNIECYVGETSKNKQHGKGELEIYCPAPGIHQKVLKKINPNWEKNNQKNFLHKTKGYLLNKKIIGIWKNGKLNGLCETITYFEPAFFINRDGTPTIMEREIGNFVGGKQEGIFKVLSNTGGSRAPKFYAYYWEYKNGSLVMDKKDKIKSIKNEKLIPDYLKKIK